MLEDQNISIKRKPGYDIVIRKKKRESDEGKIQYKKIVLALMNTSEKKKS
jgi:hypothetical protein